ncbi:related to monocarboxylate transporter 2 [Rhynchosporium agropyri]|uniref:Related to monocarboxylate transporter 2 n=1 Tax=Rhynchosporium agropyri TaxID=914238 RepID=A0A1E1JY46_9HELO|nr:related to monocarboxylate transporter 2 [Rhynchosporium agropyri]
MQSEGYIEAEASCLKKYQPSQNDRLPANAPLYDAEKAKVEDAGASRTDEPVIEAASDPAIDGKGIFENDVSPDSGNSSDTDEEKDDFPEGGLRAWFVVLGSFCGSFSVFGIINSTAVLLEYFSHNQLQANDESQIGWIFGLATFLTFFCGAPIGPIFDSYGPRALIFCGSVLLLASMFLLGLCTQYWHFIMVYSILNGIGGCLINTPCIASIGHFFLVKRGNATGIAMTAGSIGGIIFPLMLQRLLPRVGFAWATRILGFILLFLLILANLLVRSRLPRKPMASFKSVSPEFSLFYKDMPFALVSLGIFLTEWVNTLILGIGMCIIACLALWLPAGNSAAMIIAFAVIFGFVSGSNLSLSPVCVGQLCKTEHYGRYYATCWMFVSFGTLTALPIGGQILTMMDGDYTGLIIFAAASYVGAAVCLIAARVLKVGWKLNAIY